MVLAAEKVEVLEMEREVSEKADEDGDEMEVLETVGVDLEEEMEVPETAGVDAAMA
jgi:hypothetical protein